MAYNDTFEPFRNALAGLQNAALMEYQTRRQKAQDEEARTRNALAQEMAQMQIAEMQRRQQMEDKTRGIFRQSQMSPIGPYAGGYTNPVATPEGQINALYGIGNYELANDMEGRGLDRDFKREQLNQLRNPTPSYDLRETEGGFTYFPTTPGAPVPTGVRGPEKKPLVQNTFAPGGEKTPDIIEPLLKELPKMRDEALANYNAYQRLQQAMEIVNKQGSSVTGISGSVRRFFAPALAAVGMSSETTTDAEILGSLLDASAGSLRSEVVGPGPVSNYEQQILKQVSGKKISAAEGLKKVLEYHMRGKKGKLDDFNRTVREIANQPGYNVMRLIYPEISMEEAGAPGQEQQRNVKRTGTYNGRKVIEYSDGSIEYAD